MAISSSSRHAGHAAGVGANAGLQRIPQNLARATGTAAATGADAELFAQLPKTAAAPGDGAADIALGDGVANADVHVVRSLFGQDQSILSRQSQSVDLVAMLDDQLDTPGQQGAAVQATARRLPRKPWAFLGIARSRQSVLRR
jgi:hypothetical protein